MPSKFIQDPTLPQGFSITFRERFWKKVKKTDSCWVWIGGISSTGYGTIGIGARTYGSISAHVASWILENGPIPDGLYILHNCPGGDLRRCVNPGHLYAGTQLKNIEDMVSKGRTRRGESNYAHKLTWRIVEEIKTNPFQISQRQMAKCYNVSRGTIWKVINHLTWKQ